MSDTTKRRLLKLYHILYNAIYAYARISLVAVIAIVSAQVAARNLFRSNIRWNQEVALLLTIWMAFLGIAIGVDKELHIRVELFYSWFPKGFQRFVDKMNEVLLLIVGAFFTIYGVRLIISTTRSKLTVTKWPACLMYITIPIAGLCILYFVAMRMLGITGKEEEVKG